MNIRIHLVALALAVISVAGADTHFYRQDRLKLSSKTYVNKVVVSDCDYAEIKNSTFIGGLELIGCDYATVENCRIEGTSQNGALYIAPGHPWAWPESATAEGYTWKEGQQFNQGENRAAFIGRLGQKRDALLSRDGNRIRFDLSGLGKSSWLHDMSKNVWLVDGKPAVFVGIFGDNGAAAEYPAGAFLILDAPQGASAAASWFTYDPSALVRGTVVRNCTFKNPSGSGCSVYWSTGTVIEDCRAFDCSDYGIGLEFAFGGLVRGNACMMNQVYDNFPTGYHGLEIVGHAEQVVFDGNVGVVGLVPHGNRQGVTVR